jgi:hypothetical protein
MVSRLLYMVAPILWFQSWLSATYFRFHYRRQIKSTNGEQPTHRFCHVAVVYQDSMYVFGKFNLWISWTGQFGWTSNQNCFRLLGGYDGSERLNDFLRFDFAAYDLSFEVPPSTIIADFRAFVNDGKTRGLELWRVSGLLLDVLTHLLILVSDTLSDITFIVEDQPVYAHKLMLLR